MKGSRFWDVVVVSEKGQWVGFRTPHTSLRRVASYFSLVLVLCVVALTGWLLSRWQVQRLSERLASEKLKASALEAQVQDLRTRKGAPGGAGASASEGEVLGAFSLLPSLDSDEVKSATMEVDDMSAEYAPGSREWAVKFEIVRQPPREGSVRYYWVALLHGSQGVYSFPPALSSKRGESVLFHRGQAVDDVRTRRAVSARFKVDGFMQRAESEPVYVTLLVYDNKGSLLVRKRSELVTKRSANGSE